MASREPARYQAFLVMRPDGALTQVRLAVARAGSPLATVTSWLGCPRPEQVRLTSRLAMWTAGSGQHHLPCNLLAAGPVRAGELQDRRHGHPARLWPRSCRLTRRAMPPVHFRGQVLAGQRTNIPFMYLRPPASITLCSYRRVVAI
jgi:hypothetical protein